MPSAHADPSPDARSRRLQEYAHYSTIGASLVAVVTLVFGGYQFADTQRVSRENLELQRRALDVQAQTADVERETKAIELFVKFNELEQDQATKPTRNPNAKFWRNNMMLSLTESVFRLTEGDPGWKETVRWMLGVQRSFLEAEPQGCTTFAPSFVALMKAEVPKLACAK